MPHQNSFSQRDSDKNQFALRLPYCILVAILPSLFSLSFQLQPEAIVILRQRAWSLRSPQPEKSKMVQVGGLSKRILYWDHGETRHCDPYYIIKEEEAIFLSPPFPFLSFSFFFSTDLMTDNLVPKNVKTIMTKLYASPTAVGIGNSLRFWESSSPAMTKKI